MNVTITHKDEHGEVVASREGMLVEPSQALVVFQQTPYIVGLTYHFDNGTSIHYQRKEG